MLISRNLRWGRISLQNYVCAMRKSRKGRKQRITKSCQSKRTISTSGKGTRRSTGSQRASCKDALQMRDKNNKTEENDGEFSKSERDKKYVGSSMSKKQQSDIPPRASGHDGDIIQRTTHSKRNMRGMPRVVSTVVSSIDSCSSDGAKRSAETSHAATRMSHRRTSRIDDQQQQNESELSSESDDSNINFISLTPGKYSKRLQKRKNRQKAIKRSSLVNAQQNVHSRNKRMLMIQTGSQTSDTSELDDLEANYKPLFGQSRHCGGVWGSIVEESA